MELRNDSFLPDYFIRRMVRWCCKQVGYPYRLINEMSFTKRKTKYRRGSAWFRSRRIFIHVESIMRNPIGESVSSFDDLIRHEDEFTLSRLFQLVETTAHEVAHLYVYWDGGGVAEAEVRAQGKIIADDFRNDRQALIESWAEAPKVSVSLETKSKPTAADKREARNRALLKKWESKQKAAQNKVKKYRTKVRYYDRKRAAKESE